MSDTNALAMFNPGALPAHLGSFFDEVGSNIPDTVSVPSLSYTGKTWTISLDGKKTKLMSKNSDGDEVPLSTMRVIVLNSATRRGRQYYPGNYDPDKTAQPTCWSADGIAPDKSVQEPQASACDKCPRSVKGSKVTDNGKSTTECSQHRMLAVIPSGKLDFTPLRLKIAITSDWDANSPDQEAQGWFSYSKYLNFLKAHGCSHTAALVTKMKFDTNEAYPKLFFQNERWLNAEELEQIKHLPQSPEVLRLLDGSWTPAGVDGVPTGGPGNTSGGTAPQPEPETVSPPKGSGGAAVEPAPEPVPDDEDSGVMVFASDEPSPEAAAAKPAKTAKPKAEAAPKVSNEVSDELASLLDDWT